jgi:hypothetical protein
MEMSGQVHAPATLLLGKEPTAAMGYETGMLMDYIHRPLSFYRSRRFGDWLYLRPQVDVAE